MEKYLDFVNDVRKIRGLKNVNVEYDSFEDTIYIHFTPNQWKKIDDENSKMWEHFSDLLTDYDFEHGFNLYSIAVWKEVSRRR